MNYSRIGRFIRLTAFLLIVELIANINVLYQPDCTESYIRDEFMYLMFESDFENKVQILASAIMGVFACVLFSFFESAEIIRDRNIDMEHIIARYPVRWRFLSGRIRRTAAETFIYMLLSTAFYLALAVRASERSVQRADITFYVGFLLLFTLFGEFHILLMNILRIYLSQDKIILIGFLCYVVEVMVACSRLRWINCLNPYYYVLMYWDLGPAEKAAGFLWMLFLNAAAAVFMCRAVSKIDIGIRSENL